MHILVACELPDAALDQLRSLATAVRYEPNLTAQDLRDQMRDVGILVSGDIRISAETISRAKTLQMIVHAGPGPGDVALEEASGQGVFVTHCPDQHATAIAELTFGLILALDRRIVENTIALREGRWTRTELADARGLAGRTLGIVGYGTVGRVVARRARAFEMKVIAWSPALAPARPPDPDIELCNYPRELARRAEIVTVHPADDAIRLPLVDAEFLAALQPGAYLVHVGAPGAADEAALIQAIEQRQLRVAVDACGPEPLADQSRYRCRVCELPGVVGTQRVATLTQQAREATADEVVHIVRSFLVSGEVLNCINLCDRSPAVWQLVVRVRDQVGAIASILDTIRADGINAEEITNRVFIGAKAASCTIALNERPSTEALEALRALPSVLHLELRAMV